MTPAESSQVLAAQVVLPCSNLDDTLAFFTDHLRAPRRADAVGRWPRGAEACPGDCFVVPAGMAYALKDCSQDLDLLEACAPASHA